MGDTCSSCSRVIPAEDINLDRMLAKCRICNSVIDFSEQVSWPAPPGAQGAPGGIPAVASPPLEVQRVGRETVIVRRWNPKQAVPMLLFSLLWNAIVLVVGAGIVYGTHRTLARSGPSGYARLAVVFSPFLLIGLGTGWGALGLFLNRTTIRIRDHHLFITHGPIPGTGGRSVNASGIRQLSCREYVAFIQNGIPQMRCSIEALGKDGSTLRLLKGMVDPGQALELKRLLEKELGLETAPPPETR